MIAALLLCPSIDDSHGRRGEQEGPLSWLCRGVVAAAVPGNPVTSEAVGEGAGGEPVALLSALETAGEEEGGVSRPEVEEVFPSEVVVGEADDPSMRSSNTRDRLELLLKLCPKGSSAEVLLPIKRCGGGTGGRTDIG
ncbi:hypothetical protein MTO96_052245 [Rhipicephalus appendiculatus]